MGLGITFKIKLNLRSHCHGLILKQFSRKRKICLGMDNHETRINKNLNSELRFTHTQKNNKTKTVTGELLQGVVSANS